MGWAIEVAQGLAMLESSCVAGQEDILMNYFISISLDEEPWFETALIVCR